MERKCPKCGKKLPEEASFCLFCFTDIEDYKKTGKSPVACEKPSRRAGFFWGKINKKALCYASIVFVFLVAMCGCVLVMKSMNLSDKPEAENQLTVVEETSSVAVTDNSGEAVTNEEGEQVFEIIEVTKLYPVSTTEKQGIFDKLVDSLTKKPESNENKNDKPTDNTGAASTQSHQQTTEEYATSTSPLTTETTGDTKPSTTNTTEVKTTEITTTQSGSYYFEYAPQYSSSPDGNIALTKYVGNATVVTIPSYINGKKVAAINTDCFLNDSRIKEINFDDSSTYTVLLHNHCFNNLSSLNRIVFNNKGYHISSPFAYNCPITYLGKGAENQNKLIDGAYYMGNTFLWFTAHPSYTTLTLPAWCNKIDNAQNLHECSNLQVLNIHKNVLNIQKSSIYYGDGLREINVEKGHPEVFSSDGVLFYKRLSSDSLYNCVYPYKKTDKTFKLPNNCYLSMGKGSIFTTNAYLEELWLPESSCLKSPENKDFYNICYPKLKRIYISENHPQYNQIKSTFNGELIVKDF